MLSSMKIHVEAKTYYLFIHLLLDHDFTLCHFHKLSILSYSIISHFHSEKIKKLKKKKREKRKNREKEEKKKKKKKRGKKKKGV
jgi:hypothetical protein